MTPELVERVVEPSILDSSRFQRGPDRAEAADNTPIVRCPGPPRASATDTLSVSVPHDESPPAFSGRAETSTR